MGRGRGGRSNPSVSSSRFSVGRGSLISTDPPVLLSTTVPTEEKQSFTLQMSWSSALALKLPATRVFSGVSMSHPAGLTPLNNDTNGSTYLAFDCDDVINIAHVSITRRSQATAWRGH